MIDRIRDLDGEAELLTWISLANVVIAVVVLVAMAHHRTRPSAAWLMAFVLAVAAVYVRSTYRQITGTPITYAGAMIHAGIAVAGIGMFVAILRRRD